MRSVKIKLLRCSREGANKSSLFSLELHQASKDPFALGPFTWSCVKRFVSGFQLPVTRKNQWPSVAAVDPIRLLVIFWFVLEDNCDSCSVDVQRHIWSCRWDNDYACSESCSLDVAVFYELTIADGKFYLTMRLKSSRILSCWFSMSVNRLIVFCPPMFCLLLVNPRHTSLRPYTS